MFRHRGGYTYLISLGLREFEVENNDSYLMMHPFRIGDIIGPGGPTVSSYVTLLFRIVTPA